MRLYLNANDWNVHRAAQAFWEAEDAAQDPSRPPTVELDRLRQVYDMQAGLGNLPNQELRTTNAVMALLFNAKKWVQKEVEKDINERNGYYDDTINELAALRVPPEGDITRDERLARLIDITSTDSHYSALQHLIAYEWDLAMALDTWFMSGGLPVVYPPRPQDEDLLRDDGLRDLDVNANRPPRVVHGELRQSNLEQDAFDEQEDQDTIAFNRPRPEINNDPEIPWA